MRKLGKPSFLGMRWIPGEPPVTNTAEVNHLPSPFSTMEEMPRNVKSWNSTNKIAESTPGELHGAVTERTFLPYKLFPSPEILQERKHLLQKQDSGKTRDLRETQAPPSHKAVPTATREPSSSTRNQHRGTAEGSDMFRAVSSPHSQRKLHHDSRGCIWE